MDNGSKDSNSEESKFAENNSNDGQNASTSGVSEQEGSSSEERREKKRTVKQIIDEVLNCTVIHITNQAEDETTENKQKSVVKSANKIVTVKEILGEILQYNVCNRFETSPTTLNACNCGCEIPSYAPSTSTDLVVKSDLDVTVTRGREAPIYSPFQIYSSSTLQDTSIKTETILPVSVDRLLPSYSSVLRQG